MTHICVNNITIIGSDNGLSPDRRQAIIWTIAGLLLIGPLGTNFSEILIKILTFSFRKMRLKVSSAKQRPFCLGLNVLINPSVSDRDYPLNQYLRILGQRLFCDSDGGYYATMIWTQDVFLLFSQVFPSPNSTWFGSTRSWRTTSVSMTTASRRAPPSNWFWPCAEGPSTQDEVSEGWVDQGPGLQTPCLPFVNVACDLAAIAWATALGWGLLKLHSSTPNMLNCFKDYKTYIHILNRFLDLVWPK